jgi:hypothetical protein
VTLPAEATGSAPGRGRLAGRRVLVLDGAWHAGICVEGVFDPLADGVVLAADAVDVNVVQDAGAGAGPCGDFGGFPAGVQPQGQGGVPQVIGAAG